MKLNLYSEHHCRTIDEFLDLLSPRNAIWSGKNSNIHQPENWIFRGQSEDIIPIPIALRGDNSEIHRAMEYLKRPEVRKEESWKEENLQIGAEFELLRDFVDAADGQRTQLIGYDWKLKKRLQSSDVRRSLMNDPYHWPRDEYLELLALAQHYGVPTRLLDWTERSYIAAYFAASRVAENLASNIDCLKMSIVVWALEWRMAKEYIEIIRPTMGTNPHLAAQRGVLTLTRETSKAHLGLDEVIGSIENSETVLRKITLEKSEASRLLRSLYDLGIHAGSLYPTLEGAARFAKERRLWPA